MKKDNKIMEHKPIGHIFCGYPAIGKTSIGGNSIQMEDGRWVSIIDLETSLMKGNDGRPTNWVEIYVNYVQDLVMQGINVMCSTHRLVRDELEKRNLIYTNVMPNLNIKEYWLCKLRQRWKDSGLEKDRLAYERAMEYYDKDIKDLIDHDRYCMIGVERKYDLQEVLCNYIRYGKLQWTAN